MLLTLIAPTGIRFPVECSAKDSLHSVLESFLASHPEFRQTRGELQLRREKNPQSMLSLECRAEEFQGDDNSILVVIVDSQENNLPELELVEELQEITDNDEVDVGVDPFAGKLFFGKVERCIFHLEKEMDIQQLNIQDRISCVKFLKVLIFNVLHNHDAKFRKINLTHDIVRERIGKLSSVYDFFIAVGFEMSEEYAELPEKNVDLELLRRTRDLLEKKLHDLSSKKVRKFDLTGSFGSGFASAKSQTSAVDLNMKIFRDNGFLNPSIPRLTKAELEDDSTTTEDLLVLREAARSTRERTKHADKLVSKSWLNQQIASGQPRFTEVVLRFRFADKIVIEAHFSLQTKISELFDFLRAQHMDKNIPLNSFHLRVPPSKSLTHEMDSNMVEAGLLPAASLFVCGQDARNFKSAEFLDLAVLARVEEPMMVENLNFIEKEEAKSDPSSPKPKPKKKFNPKSLIKL